MKRFDVPAMAVTLGSRWPAIETALWLAAALLGLVLKGLAK